MPHTLILISDAITPALQEITQAAITSARQTTVGKDWNILVMERAVGAATYTDANTCHVPSIPFNYNGLVNHAIRQTTSERLIIANNDVVFQDGAIPALLLARQLVASPVGTSNSINPRQHNLTTLEFGWMVGRHFAGWCFAIQRAVWAYLGGFNETYPFWCADNAVVEQLKTIGVMPAVLPEARVVHLGSQTLRHLPANQIEEYTVHAAQHFDRTVGPRLSDPPRTRCISRQRIQQRKWY